MGRLINTEDLHNVVMKRKTAYGKLATLVDNTVEETVKETPTVDAVGREEYDLLKHQLADAWNRIDELDKLNGNMREKIDKSIKEMERYSTFFEYVNRHDLVGAVDYCIGVIQENIGESK